MKFRTSNHFLGILVVGLLLVLGASSNAMGQGRGRGNSHWDKKCEKFVNCHDARDGRWDGRGPNRRTGFNNNFRRYRRYRDNDFNSRRGRYRNRAYTYNRHWRHQR
ncbi:MAG TPA: hypothetical protein VN659_07900 [Pyrinomonadaceae bacterium]|nr:hypothetical protein [Pyrinomonadaceae bacterium]